MIPPRRVSVLLSNISISKCSFLERADCRLSGASGSALRGCTMNEEAANCGGLLLSLGVKGRFLRLQICDQGPNPFNRDLIADRQQHSLVMLDLFVEFGALVAHGTRSRPLTGRSLLDAYG